MKRIFPITAAFALALLAAPLTAQESSVVRDAELSSALDSHHADAEAKRSAVDRVLATDAVRNVAESMGIDLDRARSATGLLAGEDLDEANRLALAIEGDLAGGQTLSINAITLIIVLLLVVLIVLIAD